MPKAVRLGDPESHACYTTSGSDNVFVNSIPACRLNDSVCCNLTFPPHPSPGVIVEGSPNVFINSRPAARVGDATQHTNCGKGHLVDGSPNVFINS